MDEPRKPGPKRKDRTLYKGAAIQSLADSGHTPGQIADVMGVTVSLVDDVLNARGRWASLQSDVALQQYRQKNTRQLELMTRELSVKALQRIEDTIAKGGLSQAVIAFGVLQDKARLLAGESTQNIAFGGTVKIESEKLTEALARLVSSLSDDRLPVEAPAEAEIVVEKESPCETPSKKATGLELKGSIG